ncbi:MAG: BACON domain-containing protein [Ktedonobacteraceae bacterium]
MSPVVAVSSESVEVSADADDDLWDRITSPQPIISVRSLPQTPPPLSPSLPEAYNNSDIASVVDRAIQKLNEAAQCIAEVEQGSRRLPRASRLSPLRDISADIQRQSTPLPRLSQEPEVPVPQHDAPRRRGGVSNGFKTAESEPGKDLGKHMPDLWPWLQDDADTDENDHEQWSTDPLMARQFPNSAETKRIEEEDLRRALAEGGMTLPIPSRHQSPLAAMLSHRVRSPLAFLPPVSQRARRHGVSFTRRRMRRVFSVFVVLALAFLVADGVLLSFIFTHPHRHVTPLDGPPELTLSTNVASIGQTVILHIHHFSTDTHVYLTHDIQEAVQIVTGAQGQTTTGSPLVKVGANGSADVNMLVDSTWGPGYHTIEAEGVTTRYTASTTLQIIGAGPTRPAHLLIGATSLDLGADLQGANTIQLLTLHNAGGGSISWAASSDQPWLLISPTQGMFSAYQTVTVAVERANLNAGDYKGTLTFSSNVGPEEMVQVHMTVRPLPANVGAVLVVTPPVLSFTALDGGANPNGQTLMVSNPGSQPLKWSITGNNPISLAAQRLLLHALDPTTGWLSTDQTSGVVVPHGTSLIHVIVNSRNLLPGVYTDMLAFSGGQGVYNSPQNVSVSLTVQARCGLTLSSGIMSFTAVSGQSNPSNQSLSLGANTSCAGGISWNAISAANWLTVTPASGQLKGSASTVTAVGVNASVLKPGTYVSNISFSTGQNTQTLMVQLVVQAPPSPSSPILGATPLNLNFSTTQGMANPPGQVVTITNTGRSVLYWHTMVNTLASSWLGAGPTGGSIPAGQTGQVTVNIDTANLTPNTYVGQVVLIGSDVKAVAASGSPQTITVNLLVLPPCTLEKPSLSAVTFSATQGSSSPASQPISITASGNCGWPLNWQAQVANAPAWLQLAPASGTLVASGQSTSMTVNANIAGLTANTYTTEITLTATDGSNTAVQGNSQTISVTLTVLPPCSLQVGASNLTFSVGQGQPAPPAQSFSLSESGNCARPVSWSVSGEPGTTGVGGWLVLSQPFAGTDSGIIHVGINPQNLLPNTYTSTITISASGSGGAIVQGSPMTVTVSLIVTGFSLGGTVIACSNISCSSTKPLPGASLTLLNNATNRTITITADGSGNYAFTNLALGPYTLTIAGSDGTYNYAGTVTLNLGGAQAHFSVNAYPQ